jgi:hypothetical protein
MFLPKIIKSVQNNQFKTIRRGRVGWGEAGRGGAGRGGAGRGGTGRGGSERGGMGWWRSDLEKKRVQWWR